MSFCIFMRQCIYYFTFTYSAFTFCVIYSTKRVSHGCRHRRWIKFNAKKNENKTKSNNSSSVKNDKHKQYEIVANKQNTKPILSLSSGDHYNTIECDVFFVFILQIANDCFLLLFSFSRFNTMCNVGCNQCSKYLPDSPFKCRLWGHQMVWLHEKESRIQSKPCIP